MSTPAIVRQLGVLFEGGSLAGLSDRQLVERFDVGGDEAAAEAAFAALVARHGPMVLSVCRQILGDRHLAEDAFQAAFLVLARKARSLGDPDRLGPWLYGVALRTARKAQARAARHRRHEQGDVMDARRDTAEPTAPPADQALLDRDEAEALHREVDRLPDAFRSPIVLCYFEGLTLDEAAVRLRCPAGTLRSRLARAREKLRRALTRRGFALSDVALAAALESRSISLSSHLCDITARAAVRFAARQAVASTAASLAHEVLRTMTIHKLRTTCATLLLLAALAAGGGYLARPVAGGDEPRKAPAIVQAPAAGLDDAAEKPAPGRMFVVGRVLDPQGKPTPGATVMVYAVARFARPIANFQPVSTTPIGHGSADGSGRFRLDVPRTDSARYFGVRATALAPGYGLGWAVLDPDADRPAAEIRLQPEQVIQGRAFDVQGRPVRDLKVSVSSLFRRDPGRGPDAGGGPDARSVSLGRTEAHDLPGWPRPARTDAEGRFTLRGVGRGLTVVMSVDDPRYARQTWIPVETGDASSSKPLRISLEPAQIIAGRVTYADTGGPVPQATLDILSSSIDTYFQTDGEGRFRANPAPDTRFHVTALPPEGQPYLSLSKRLDWPKGAVERSIDLALPRGVPIRGKVVEEGSGRPVAGAAVWYEAPRTPGAGPMIGSRPATTSGDGSFTIAVPPGPGHLVIQGPSDDFVLREIGSNQLYRGQPGGLRVYSHAFIACDPKPGDNPEVNVALRRGVTVEGRLIGPDGRTIREARIIGRTVLGPYGQPWRQWRGGSIAARDGRFEMHGLDPGAEVPVHVLEPKGKLGATAMLSGRSGADGPVTIRLEPCAAARARLVDRDGKPVAGSRDPRLIVMVVTPGLPPGVTNPPEQLAAHEAILSRVDPVNYGDAPASGADGRIVFPALIPGASYSIRVGPRNGPPSFRKDFTVRPGETVELGDIPIEKP